MFSPIPVPETITPVYYLYNVVFGSSMFAAGGNINVGVGAAIGAILTILVVVLYSAINLAIPEKKLEY
ncbi:unnamed protein product [marine sediment metagenome]|uniref:ABC transmembrane type-1 domain-containing protein n=1 Tax=marine sediment metagenome TaxID=412755 RepID=X1D3A8_9ZZZZ